MFASADIPATAERTRQRLGWAPTKPALLADMAEHYFG
jgi:hypothetical protein